MGADSRYLLKHWRNTAEVFLKKEHWNACSLKAWNFIKKRPQRRCFPEKTYFAEHLRMTASENAEVYSGPSQTSKVKLFANDSKKLLLRCLTRFRIRLWNVKLRFLNQNLTLDKVFLHGPSKICGRQLLNNLKEYDLLKQTILVQNF